MKTNYNKIMERSRREDEDKRQKALLESGNAQLDCVSDGSLFTLLFKWVLLCFASAIVTSIACFIFNGVTVFRGDIAFNNGNYIKAYEVYSSVSPGKFMHYSVDFINPERASEKQVNLLDTIFEEYELAYPVIEDVGYDLDESYFTSCEITDAGKIEAASIPKYSEKYEEINSLIDNIVEADYVSSKNFMIVKNSTNTLYTFAIAGSTFNTTQIKGTNLYNGETFENVDFFRYFGDVLYVKHLDGTWTVSGKMASFSYMTNVDMADVEDVLSENIFKKTDGTYFLVDVDGTSANMYPFVIPEGTEISEFYGSVLLLNDGTLFNYGDQVTGATAITGVFGIKIEKLMINMIEVIGDEKIETILMPALYKTFILTEEGSLYYCDAESYKLLATDVETLYAAELGCSFDYSFSYGSGWDFDVYATKDGKCIPLLTYYVSSIHGHLDYDFDDVRSFYYGGILFNDGTVYPEASTSEYLVDETGSLVSIYDIVV